MSCLEFDFGGCSDRNIPGHGVGDAEIAGHLAAMEGALASFKEEGKRPSFLDLPDELAGVHKLLLYVAGLSMEIENVVVLGIGGSSLGPRALIDALSIPANPGKAWRGGEYRRVLFLDNVDPEVVYGTLYSADPHSTLYIVISKSGSTVETAAQLLVVTKVLSEVIGEGWEDHMVVVTDPEAGPLREMANAKNLYSLDVPTRVGGRFSVLSSVGLLPAALAGVEVGRVLGGAAAARDALLGLPAAENPAAVSAALHVEFHRRGMPIRIVMPYRHCLGPMAEWFQQLWAESLGKNDRSGTTPVKAVGVTDQHSQLQLYMEGPRDKVVNLWSVASSRAEVEIPDESPVAAFDYLKGKTLSALLSAELSGTRTALARAGRPVVELKMERIDEETIGALFMTLEVETALAAAAYGVDAYDQPGVELGKKFAFGIIERAGFEKFRDQYRGMETKKVPWSRKIEF